MPPTNFQEAPSPPTTRHTRDHLQRDPRTANSIRNTGIVVPLVDKAVDQSIARYGITVSGQDAPDMKSTDSSGFTGPEGSRL